MDIVEQLFNDVDVQVIWSIPLINTQANDLFYLESKCQWKILCDDNLSPSYGENDFQQ